MLNEVQPFDLAPSPVAEKDDAPKSRGVPAASNERAPDSSSAEAAPVLSGPPTIENLLQWPASSAFVEKFPISFARKHGVLGLTSTDSTLPVAVVDPRNLVVLDIVSRHMARRVRPYSVSSDQMAAAINLAYQQRTGQVQALIENLDPRQILDEVSQLSSRDDLLDNSGRAPVIKLVNLLLFEAVKQSASDIHIQPYEDSLIIRLRIDGVLFDAFTLGKGLQEEVVSRVKVLGRMNIAEKRLAQDGRATVQVGDRVVDLRIASLPTSFGERIVIRLLDKSARLYTLRELGMPLQVMEQFSELINAEHGLILVTGPTGAGKSTTLYAALQELNAKELNILTLEDPIEYQLPGISQTQVSDKKGMTFASGLRHVLRQDPDIIMVGEIRDRETAVMAIQSALTGHLVFSTLHTNDSASAITRLLDLGIEPYLAASSVVGVLAQRLVRSNCSECSVPHSPPADSLRRLGLDGPRHDLTGIRQGKGCSHCRDTGFRGRIGIFELLTVDRAVRQKIQACATAADIKSAAQVAGMTMLRDNGIEKIVRGQTTIDEVLRVTMRNTD